MHNRQGYADQIQNDYPQVDVERSGQADREISSAFSVSERHVCKYFRGELPEAVGRISQWKLF